MLDVVTLGEAMVVFVPERTGLLRYATRFDRFVAGAEANVATGLARLGHSVGFVTRVGNDEFGQVILGSLRAEGVDVSRATIDSEAPTGIFFKERRRPGETRAHYYRARSAASHLSPQDIPQDYVADSRCLHLTGITPALSQSCRAALNRAIEIAREAGRPIAFDPNIRLKLWSAEAARTALLEIIPAVDWVLLSLEEAELLTGAHEPDVCAIRIQELGPSTVVVKLGADGAFGRGSDETIHAPAFPFETVETTGAGDAFDAGFISAQLRGWSLADSLRLGNVLGGLATTTLGDTEGLPSWAEAQTYLGTKGLPPR